MGLNIDKKGIGLGKKRLMNFPKKLVAQISDNPYFDKITCSIIGFNLFYYFHNHMWKEGLVLIKLLMDSGF